jgi:integrase
MARTKPKERARTRILSDDEIRDLHTALDTLGKDAPKCFPAFVRALLLTGQRLRMVSNLPWSEIEGSEWTVPPERNKTGLDHLVPLTATVAALIGTKGKGYVFSSDGGKTPFSGFSKSKAALDAKLTEIRKAAGRKPMQPWVFHDLRRSSRSLMSRAGVSSDHAERVLGHVIPGVRGTYDRHEYADEKRAALEKLDAQINRILRPGQAVIRFPKKRSRNSRP